MAVSLQTDYFMGVILATVRITPLRKSMNFSLSQHMNVIIKFCSSVLVSKIPTSEPKFRVISNNLRFNLPILLLEELNLQFYGTNHSLAEHAITLLVNSWHMMTKITPWWLRLRGNKVCCMVTRKETPLSCGKNKTLLREFFHLHFFSSNPYVPSIDVIFSTWLWINRGTDLALSLVSGIRKWIRECSLILELGDEARENTQTKKIRKWIKIRGKIPSEP